MSVYFKHLQLFILNLFALDCRSMIVMIFDWPIPNTLPVSNLQNWCLFKNNKIIHVKVQLSKILDSTGIHIKGVIYKCLTLNFDSYLRHAHTTSRHIPLSIARQLHLLASKLQSVPQPYNQPGQRIYCPELKFIQLVNEC